MDRVEPTPWGLSRVGEESGLATSALTFLCGAGVLFLLPWLPPLWLSALLVAMLFALAWRLAPLRPLAFATVGFLWAQVHACQMICAPFPERFSGQNLELTGRIAGLPGEAGGASRFLLKVEAARLDRQDIGFDGLVRLNWYRGAPDLLAGERWRLTARLKPPHGFANPGGFDYERWLFQQGIKATGYVRGSAENWRLEVGPGSYVIDRWRQRLRERIGEILGGSTGEGLVRALVLGDRSGLDPEQWEVLTRTGTNHLIAISGLHVGIVAGFVFFLFRWGWSRSARLTLYLPAPRAAAVAALSAAVAYSALAGFAVSTQRALIMLAVVLGAVLAARTIRPANGIALALLGVLIVDPLALLSYGFWLSFGAVAALLFALGQRVAAGGLWSKWGQAQWAVALGLLPLLFLLFGRASLIAPLVNLIAVPLFSLVLLPAVLVSSLIGLIPGFELPLDLSATALEWSFRVLEAVSDLSWATVFLSARPTWVWAAAFAGAILLLAPRGLPGRWLGLLLLAPLSLTHPVVPGRGEAWFTLLDVGQGLAAVVRTRNHALVYDTGPRYPSGFNTGSAVVLPYLRHVGVSNVDVLVLSHGDRDHAGGFAGLDGRFPIGQILGGEPGEIPGATAMPCLAGGGWTWDGVEFEFLYPVSAGREGNDSSCVLRVGTQGASVLLPGDVDKGVEAELVAGKSERLRSTILVAAHHGSDTSTGDAFLDAVAPGYVLYSVGYGNRFGFPAEAVRERVAAQGGVQFDTASGGAIEFRLGGTGIDGPRLYRGEEARLWTHRAGEGDAPF